MSALLESVILFVCGFLLQIAAGFVVSTFKLYGLIPFFMELLTIASGLFAVFMYRLLRKKVVTLAMVLTAGLLFLLVEAGRAFVMYPILQRNPVALFEVVWLMSIAVPFVLVLCGLYVGKKVFSR